MAEMTIEIASNPMILRNPTLATITGASFLETQEAAIHKR
jgi:hypothetical protein